METKYKGITVHPSSTAQLSLKHFRPYTNRIEKDKNIIHAEELLPPCLILWSSFKNDSLHFSILKFGKKIAVIQNLVAT